MPYGTLKQFAAEGVFGRDVKTIGKHINNALQEELRDMTTAAKFAIVQQEGYRKVNRIVVN